MKYATIDEVFRHIIVEELKAHLHFTSPVVADDIFQHVAAIFVDLIIIKCTFIMLQFAFISHLTAINGSLTPIYDCSSIHRRL